MSHADCLVIVIDVQCFVGGLGSESKENEYE